MIGSIALKHYLAPHENYEELNLLPAQTRMFVVEDDILYAKFLQHFALEYNIHLDVFHPDSDFYNLPRDGEYDVGIIDYDLGYLKGTQIASLYASTPILLISAQDKSEKIDSWPSSVCGFSLKHEGVKNLIEKSLTLAGKNGWPSDEGSSYEN